MRKRIGVTMLALAMSGCAGCGTQAPKNTTTTTTAEPEISAQACVRIGTAQTDPTLKNLQALGHTIAYEDGKWFFDGTRIGEARFEDHAFDACGPVELISTITAEQDAVIASGADIQF